MVDLIVHIFFSYFYFFYVIPISFSCFSQDHATNQFKTVSNPNETEENKLLGMLLEEKKLSRLKEQTLKQQIQSLKKENSDLKSENAQKVEYLNNRLELLLNENNQLNKLLNESSQKNLGQIKNQMLDLESKVNILINDNEILNELNVDLNERLNVYQQKITLLEGSDQENVLVEQKMEELQKKLLIVFEDNDKLSNIIREREEDFFKLQNLYERELKLRGDLENKYDHILQRNADDANESQNKNISFILENSKLNEILLEKTRHYQEIEYKLDMLTKENMRLNSINEENNLRIKEINEQFESQMTYLKTNNSEVELEEYRALINDLENKVEILLNENMKLHSLFDEKLKEFQNPNQEFEEKFFVMLDENKKLNKIIKEKEENEAFWKAKFLEMESKIKMLFFSNS